MSTHVISEIDRLIRKAGLTMNRKKKMFVVGIVVILVVVVAVVAVVTLTSTPGVAGTYMGRSGGVQITLAKDGSFTQNPSLSGLNSPDHYWVNGKNVAIGIATSGPKGWPSVLKIEGKDRLVGFGTVWVKLKPNWPSSLFGTYISSDKELLVLGDDGAVADIPHKPSSVAGWTGTWVAGKNTVTVTYPNLEKGSPLKTTYTINGKNLTGGGKEFVKKWNPGVTPNIK